MEGSILEPFACLYIVRGEPFRPGTCLNLTLNETTIGRTSSDYSPDIAFANAFISRKHLEIRLENNQAVLYDLGSRHGTEINGMKAEPHQPYPLQPFDIIKLAKGMTVIHYTDLFVDQTLEFELARTTTHSEEKIIDTSIDWDKRECLVSGNRIVMSEKEYLLLKLLHDHANRMVTIQEIKQAVWADRIFGADGQPDVHKDELNALIYRIRKKYGKDTFLISSIRGIGYVLETDLYNDNGK